jgi:hypothetical protein
MKKTIITLAVLGAVVSSGFSQGFVFFTGGAANATKVSTNSALNGAATGRVLGDGSYYYALFASSSQTAVNGNTAAFSGSNGSYVFQNLGGGTASTGWALVGIGTNNSTSTGTPGQFTAASQGTTSGNQAGLNADNSLTVSGIAGGAAGNFVVIGWSVNIGSTLAALETWYGGGAGSTLGWVGQSRVGDGQTLGDGGSNPTQNVFGSTANFINGFTLGEFVPTPEPGTLALAALGGASLLLFRRKK